MRFKFMVSTFILFFFLACQKLNYNDLCVTDPSGVYSKKELEKLRSMCVDLNKTYGIELFIYSTSDSLNSSIPSDSLYCELSTYTLTGKNRILYSFNTVTQQGFLVISKDLLKWDFIQRFRTTDRPKVDTPGIHMGRVNNLKMIMYLRDSIKKNRNPKPTFFRIIIYAALIIFFILSLRFGRKVYTNLREKRCSHCGKTVSIASKAGEKCPHCGAYWSHEKKITST